jgi:hypothetical protein
LVGEKVFAINKQQEGWRRLPYLSSVKEFEPESVPAYGLPPFDGVLQRAIEDGSGDFLL